MDQFKEYLNQAIKYRFWIAIGVACLLPLIGYFAGTGGIAEAAKKEKDNIERSNKDVQAYVNGQIYNGTWKKVVDEKTAIVSKDVDASWRKLYIRQAPLLDWPKEVEDTIPVWGPQKWPEGVDSQKVNLVINDYLQVYPGYVDKVYESFHPYNPADGTGIVASPVKDLLLKPAVFDETNPPSLGKVWNAQRKLWVENTMLDIIKRVNDKAKAKNWDEAPIKQILDLEVASPNAQDQKSVAKGDTLKEPDDILDPRAPAPVASTSTSSGFTAPSGRSGSASFAPGAGANNTSAATSSFHYISSGGGDSQFITVPVAMKVYIDQERIPDLLVEFQNSPMDIKVKDFELKPPTTPVIKPHKGVDQTSYAGGMGISGGHGRGGNSGTLGSEGFAGKGGPRGLANMKGYPGAGSNGSANYAKGAGSGGGAYVAPKTGISKAGDVLQNIKDKRAIAAKKGDEDEEKEKDAGSTTSDPYFNVVEVTIKGQARFYVAPPPLPAAEGTSPGAPPAEAPKPAAPPEAPKTDAAKPTDLAKDAPKPEASKTEPAKDAPAPADAKDAPKPETPKADAPKDAAPKSEESKPAEPAKDAPKTDAPKPDAPKTDAPKSDADKPKDMPK